MEPSLRPPGWGALPAAATAASTPRPTDRLFSAAVVGDCEEIALLLAQGEADVSGTAERDWTERMDMTPLMYAADGGHAAAVQLLLEHGAPADARSEGYGYTALHWACRGGHLDVVKLLCAAGCSLNTRDETQWSGRDWAAHEGHGDCVSYLDHWHSRCCLAARQRLCLAQLAHPRLGGESAARCLPSGGDGVVELLTAGGNRPCRLGFRTVLEHLVERQGAGQAAVLKRALAAGAVVGEGSAEQQRRESGGWPSLPPQLAVAAAVAAVAALCWALLCASSQGAGPETSSATLHEECGWVWGEEEGTWVERCSEAGAQLPEDHRHLPPGTGYLPPSDPLAGTVAAVVSAGAVTVLHDTAPAILRCDDFFSAVEAQEIIAAAGKPSPAAQAQFGRTGGVVWLAHNHSAHGLSPVTPWCAFWVPEPGCADCAQRFGRWCPASQRWSASLPSRPRRCRWPSTTPASPSPLTTTPSSLRTAVLRRQAVWRDSATASSPRLGISPSTARPRVARRSSRGWGSWCVAWNRCLFSVAR